MPIKLPENDFQRQLAIVNFSRREGLIASIQQGILNDVSTPISEATHLPEGLLSLLTDDIYPNFPMGITGKDAVLTGKTFIWVRGADARFPELRPGSRIIKLDFATERMRTKAPETLAQEVGFELRNLATALSTTPDDTLVVGLTQRKTIDWLRPELRQARPFLRIYDLKLSEVPAMLLSQARDTIYQKTELHRNRIRPCVISITGAGIRGYLKATGQI